MSRRCTIFLLDYFYLPDIYLQLKQNIGDGYGTEWGLTILPNFFANGGNIAILPNDKWDRMRNLLNAPQITVYSIVTLSTADARLYHPLYAATDAITDSATGTLNGTGHCNTRRRNNDTQQRLYLHPETPFYVVYKSAFLSSNELALSYLEGLLLPFN
jgi:hypothetical protein